MSEHVTRLRKAAEEIRREGHAGWGNTCEEAADEIERLQAENERLRDLIESNMSLRDEFQDWDDYEPLPTKDSAEMGDPWVGPAHHERR